MSEKLKSKDLLTLTELTKPEFEAIMKKAVEVKKKGPAYQPLRGKTVGLLFRKTSTRTRISFQAGVNQLGGQALDLPAERLQFKVGETVADTARVLSRYLDALVIRTFEQAELEEFAAHAGIPVINGLTDYCHPCQVLADLFTLRQAGRKLAALRLVYLGDGNNVANSLVFGAALCGCELVLSSPRGWELKDEVLERAKEMNPKVAVSRVGDPARAVAGADVLYTDTWVSMGQEKAAAKLKAMRPYQLNAQLLARAAQKALVMHCLPAHRGQEITDEVIDGPQSIVFQQAENRMHVQKALLVMLIR